MNDNNISDLENQIQREFWKTVIDRNREILIRKKPADSEEENIRLLKEMTELTEREIRFIAAHVRKNILWENKRKKNQQDLNNKLRIKTIVVLFITITLIGIVIFFIGQYVKNTMDADALCEAADNGNYDRINLLLNKGANINAKDFLGRTALIIAVDSGHTEVVRLLVSRGANINIRDDYNRTAIDWAEERNSKELIDILGQVIAESTPPNSAIRNLWDMGFPFTGISFYNAVLWQNLDAVKLFLSAGMDPISVYNEYKSAMEAAITFDNIEMISLFLSHIPQKTTKQVAAAFYDAVKNNKINIVEMFLNWGIDLDKIIHFDIFLLFDVTDYTILKLLLENGIDVNVRDKYGTSALIQVIIEHELSEDRRIPLVQLLLKFGADPNVSNKNGRLIDQAVKAGRKEIVQLLYQAGAKE